MDDPTKEEQLAWDMYFCSIVAFQFHPANKAAWQEMDLTEYAEIVEAMMIVRRRYRTRGE